jgi:hypothetical protein
VLFRSADILQLNLLQVAPDPFIRVEVRCIAGQLLQMDALGATLRQEALHGFATMDGRAIPNDQQLALNVPQQMLQEAHDILATIGLLLHLYQQAAAAGERANHRQMIIAEWCAQDRRLPARSVGTANRGQQVEAGLIYPDDRALLAPRFFFSAGQRWSCQAWIAASFRSLARVIGFWTLNPSRRRRRETCAG